MLDDLRHELAEPLPHPDAAALRNFSSQAIDWVWRHYVSLSEQRIGQTATRAEMERLLREPPPETGRDFAQVLAEFEEKVAAKAFRPNNPRFFAFIPSAPTYLSILGELLCAGTNFFQGVWVEAPGPSAVELLVLDWFKEFLGYPAEARGLLTSGGSEANLTALLVARERLSLAERERAVLYVTEQRHWSVDRAAKIMGLRPEQIQPVPADEQFRMTAAALADAVRQDRAAGRLPWVVVANGGATNTGTVDPLATLADCCVINRLWFHIDAAYGWSAALTAEGKELLKGIDRADSITLDPHKWFGQTFDAGCVLVRDGVRLQETFRVRADYMQDVEPADDEINFCDHGMALTRRFRALKIWLSVKVLGVGWFRSLIERCCRLAAFSKAVIESRPDFEILCPPQLSMICFRYVPAGWQRTDPAALDRLNLAMVEELRATGRAFISSTRLRGQVALRFCFVNYRTTATDVEEVVRLLAEIGERLAGDMRR